MVDGFADGLASSSGLTMGEEDEDDEEVLRERNGRNAFRVMYVLFVCLKKMASNRRCKWINRPRNSS